MFTKTMTGTTTLLIAMMRSHAFQDMQLFGYQILKFLTSKDRGGCKANMKYVMDSHGEIQRGELTTWKHLADYWKVISLNRNLLSIVFTQCLLSDTPWITAICTFQIECERDTRQF
jgi:hypothetical protein